MHAVKYNPAIDGAAQAAALMQTVAAQQQRIAGLEEMQRQSEGAMAAVLQRLKEAELALNSVHRALQGVAPDVATLRRQVAAQGERAEQNASQWRAHTQRLEAALNAELREALHQRPPPPPPITAEPAFQNVVQELQRQRAALEQLQSNTRALAEAHATDSRALRTIEAAHAATATHLGETVAAQRDAAAETQRRLEALDSSVRTGGQVLLRQAMETARAEAAKAAEADELGRRALQSDVAASLVLMRAEVSAGVSRCVEASHALDEMTHGLEAVLRAEVRGRIASSTDTIERLDLLERATAGLVQGGADRSGSPAPASAPPTAVGETLRLGVDDVRRDVSMLTRRVAALEQNSPTGGVADRVLQGPIAAARRGVDDATTTSHSPEKSRQDVQALRRDLADLEDRVAEAVDGLRKELTTLSDATDRTGNAAGSGCVCLGRDGTPSTEFVQTVERIVHSLAMRL